MSHRGRRAQDGEPQLIGYYMSDRFGRIAVWRAHYVDENGPLAVMLTMATTGEPLTKLSVNMSPPNADRDSADLPPGCFFARTWAENAPIAAEAIASSARLFIERPDLGEAKAGYNAAPVWQLRGES